MAATLSSTRTREILATLVYERQRLRYHDANSSELEANRLGIVYWQSVLSEALIAEHMQLPGQ